MSDGQFEFSILFGVITVWTIFGAFCGRILFYMSNALDDIREELLKQRSQKVSDDQEEGEVSSGAGGLR